MAKFLMESEKLVWIDNIHKYNLSGEKIVEIRPVDPEIHLCK